jgi:hypothetical protein
MEQMISILPSMTDPHNNNYVIIAQKIIPVGEDRTTVVKARLADYRRKAQYRDLLRLHELLILFQGTLKVLIVW